MSTHSVNETFTNNKIQWTKIKHDVNGNPRYVCHFLELLTPKEQADYEERHFLQRKYANALKRAHKLGGRKFHNKQYGGGIVFQSYNLSDLEKSILELLERES